MQHNYLIHCLYKKPIVQLQLTLLLIFAEEKKNQSCNEVQASSILDIKTNVLSSVWQNAIAIAFLGFVFPNFC